MMAVAVTTGSELRVGVPKELFEARYYSESADSGSQLYDVSPDGEQFLMIQEGENPTELRVVLNWFEELEARAPSAR